MILLLLLIGGSMGVIAALSMILANRKRSRIAKEKLREFERISPPSDKEIY